jgi:hypothetical protein
MDRDGVLRMIFENKGLRAFLGRLDESYRDDAYGEMLLRMCAMPEEKLVAMYDRNPQEPIRYAVSVLSSFRSKNNTFYRVYRRKTPNDYPNPESYQEPESDPEREVPSLKSLSWVENRLLEVYIECGSFREVSRKTGLHEIWISKKINMARSRIKAEENAKMRLQFSVPVEIHVKNGDDNNVREWHEAIQSHLLRALESIPSREGEAITALGDFKIEKFRKA